MNQKDLNKYLKYMTSLSDKDREALYSKHLRLKRAFSSEEISKRLREPIKLRTKDPYREFDGGFGYDCYFPQITIKEVTSKGLSLGNGVTVRRVKKKGKDDEL